MRGNLSDYQQINESYKSLKPPRRSTQNALLDVKRVLELRKAGRTAEEALAEVKMHPGVFFQIIKRAKLLSTLNVA